MRLNMRIIPVLGGLALATMVAPYAHACGEYRSASFSFSSPRQFGSPYLLRASLAGQDEASAAEPTMVGTWKEHWIANGDSRIPDGVEIDSGYAQWHSDGTEINLSGLRSPLIGNVCMGEWVKTGRGKFQMNHFGISYDPTGTILVGPAHIQQFLTLDDAGMNTSGRFVIDQFDEAGNMLAHVVGNIIGTRVTMKTGFEKVE